MPSPWRPTRVTVSRSIKGRSDEELAVAFAARERRDHNPGDAPAERGHKASAFLACRDLSERIAHDSLFQPDTPALELGLDQREQRCRSSHQRKCGAQHKLERD